MTCNARHAQGDGQGCQLDEGHNGMHWDNMMGHFWSPGDNKEIRRAEQKIIVDTSITEHNKSKCRPEGSVCNCVAGLCPKPAHTFGEGHYCDLLLFHTGPHHCRCCDLEFTADIPAWTYRHI